MNKKIVTTGIATMALLSMGCSISHADSNMVGKSASPRTALNLRDLNTNNVIGKLLTCDTVTVLGDLGNGFVKVKTKSGMVGKCAKEYLNVKTSSKTTTNSSAATTSSKKVVNGNGLKLRKGAGSNFSVIKTMSKGTVVESFEVKNGWRKVIVNGTTGWCADHYLSSYKATSSAQNKVNTSTQNKVSTTTQAKKSYNNPVSKYTTSYNNKNDRAKNVELAARKINNVVIKPGKSISFSKLVGERTLANGYVNAPVMSNGQANQNGVGGGICQVSTTLYNAALEAGLYDIKSRNHSGRVSYVSAGTDAMISQYQDLVIKNTYKEDIVILASYSGGKLTVRINSENPLLGGKKYEKRLTKSKSGLTVKLDLVEKSGKKEKVVYTRTSDYVR